VVAIGGLEVMAEGCIGCGDDNVIEAGAWIWLARRCSYPFGLHNFVSGV
jgi:hypothetical protein